MKKFEDMVKVEEGAETNKLMRQLNTLVEKEFDAHQQVMKFIKDETDLESASSKKLDSLHTKLFQAYDKLESNIVLAIDNKTNKGQKIKF